MTLVCGPFRSRRCEYLPMPTVDDVPRVGFFTSTATVRSAPEENAMGVGTVEGLVVGQECPSRGGLLGSAPDHPAQMAGAGAVAEAVNPPEGPRQDTKHREVGVGAPELVVAAPRITAYSISEPLRILV